MSVQQSIVNGFISRRGLITYSMLGSRNGSDGTGDCSGIMSQVLRKLVFQFKDCRQLSRSDNNSQTTDSIVSVVTNRGTLNRPILFL